MPNNIKIVEQDIDRIVSELGAYLHPLSGSTILVTGSNGFLCSYFVDTVAAANYAVLDPPCRVIAVDNFQTGVRERLHHLRDRDEIEFIQHDIKLPLNLEQPPDWIVHGASIASPMVYRRYPLETIDVNVMGTRQILELARQGTRSMLYLSSSEIYGDPDPGFVPTREDYRGNVSCTGPRACYDESKRLAETLCITYHRLYGIPVKIVRPFNIYGPGQRLDDKRIIPDLMSAAVRQEPIDLYSEGLDTRAFCYVADAVLAMWHVLLSDVEGEIFNIGNDHEEITIRELAEQMRLVAGPPWLEIRRRVSEDHEYLTDSPQRRCPDLTRIRERLQWGPKVSLREGLERTLRSYRELETADVQLDESR